MHLHAPASAGLFPARDMHMLWLSAQVFLLSVAGGSTPTKSSSGPPTRSGPFRPTGSEPDYDFIRSTLQHDRYTIVAEDIAVHGLSRLSVSLQSKAERSVCRKETSGHYMLTATMNPASRKLSDWNVQAQTTTETAMIPRSAQTQQRPYIATATGQINDVDDATTRTPTTIVVVVPSVRPASVARQVVQFSRTGEHMYAEPGAAVIHATMSSLPARNPAAANRRYLEPQCTQTPYVPHLTRASYRNAAWSTAGL